MMINNCKDCRRFKTAFTKIDPSTAAKFLNAFKNAHASGYISKIEQQQYNTAVISDLETQPINGFIKTACNGDCTKCKKQPVLSLTEASALLEHFETQRIENKITAEQMENARDFITKNLDPKASQVFLTNLTQGRA